MRGRVCNCSFPTTPWVASSKECNQQLHAIRAAHVQSWLLPTRARRRARSVPRVSRLLFPSTSSAHCSPPPQPASCETSISVALPLGGWTDRGSTWPWDATMVLHTLWAGGMPVEDNAGMPVRHPAGQLSRTRSVAKQACGNPQLVLTRGRWPGLADPRARWAVGRGSRCRVGGVATSKRRELMLPVPATLRQGSLCR